MRIAERFSAFAGVQNGQTNNIAVLASHDNVVVGDLAHQSRLSGIELIVDPFAWMQRDYRTSDSLIAGAGGRFVMKLARGLGIEREIELVFPTKLTRLFPPDFARYLAGLTVYLARFPSGSVQIALC